MIFTVRTTVGREKTAIDSINVKIQGSSGPVKAVMSPAELKGYIFVEGDDEDSITEALRAVPHVKGLIKKKVEIEQIESFFENKYTFILKNIPPCFKRFIWVPPRFLSSKANAQVFSNTFCHFFDRSVRSKTQIL